jgi:hypothetical protein
MFSTIPMRLFEDDDGSWISSLEPRGIGGKEPWACLCDEVGACKD